MNVEKPLNLCLHRLSNLSIFVLIPISQHVSDARTVRQLINLLEVLLRKLKRLSSNVGNILPNQLARIDGRLVDLCEQEAAEGFDAGTEEGAVEGDVDAFERNGSEAAL